MRKQKYKLKGSTKEANKGKLLELIQHAQNSHQQQIQDQFSKHIKPQILLGIGS